MDGKKRRSVLRNPNSGDCVSTDATPRLKRRISFSGKHLVREFQSEEEPKTWNNSYEISDHLHLDETAAFQICVSKNQSLRSTLKKPNENKENDNVQVISLNESQNRRNVSATNNSVLCTTGDFINVSHKEYNIENTVDISLCERELKYRVAVADDHTTTYTNSFPVDENEKELASLSSIERTVDFMRNDAKTTLKNDLTLYETLNMQESSMIDDCNKNDGGFTVYNEFTDGIQNMEVTCAENKRSKERNTIYMNDSMSTSWNEQPTTGTKQTIEKRKTLQRSVAMDCSPINTKQCDKENIMPLALHANATINKSCYMETDGNRCLGPKIKVNVDRESREFHEKLDQLSFVGQSDDDNMDITQMVKVGGGGAIPKVKSRPTINFNQPIEVSAVNDKMDIATQMVKVGGGGGGGCAIPKVKSRPTINFNQPIEESAVNDKMDIATQMVKVGGGGAIPKVKSRPTINFNQPIEVSAVNDKMDIATQMVKVGGGGGGAIPKVKSRPTINFNQPIELSAVKDKSNTKPRQTVNYNENISEVSPVTVKSNRKRQTVNFLNEDIHEDSLVKVKSSSMRQTINFNADISSLSPANTVKSNHLRQTVNFNEDIPVTPLILSQESTMTTNGHHLNKPATSIRTNGQPLVVRKICTPLVNKAKTQVELEQQRMLRFKKKLEQDIVTENVKHDAADKPPTAIKSVNVSLCSVKNLSLSPDSSSPLIPSEFKVYNLKQLNDELERGNLHVYSNAPKTPLTDRKTKASLQFSKNLQCSESSKQRRTLVFDDADIPIAAANDTLTNAFKSIKSNDYFDFYSTHEPAIDREKKKIAKCRYSQADDMMLDNTSFLTQAKLGDETASRNNSKRDATLINNIDIVCDEPIREASMQHVIAESCVKSPKGMSQNDEPILRQPSTNTNNETSSNIQNDKQSTHSNVKKRHTMHLNDDILSNHNENKLQKDKTQIELENNMDIDDENTRENVNRKTIYVNNDMEIDTQEEVEQNQCKSSNNEGILSKKPLRSSTIFFKNDIPNIDNENSDKIIQQQKKQNHLRNTLHFDNENIENEEPRRHGEKKTIAETLKSSRQTKHFENEEDIDAETQNSPKGRNARQTLYLNRDIEADQNHDWNIENQQANTKNALDKQKESSNNQNQIYSRRTMLFDSENIDSDEAAHGGGQNNWNMENQQANTKNALDKQKESSNNQNQRYARRTKLFDSENIDSDEAAHGGGQTDWNIENQQANTKNALDKPEVSSNHPNQIYSRFTMHFDSENIDSVEAAHGGEQNNWNIENQQANAANALDKPEVSSNHQNQRYSRHTIHFDSDEVAHGGDQNKDSHATSKTKQQTFNNLVDDNDLNPIYSENFKKDRDEQTGEIARQNMHYNIDVTVDTDALLANRDVVTTSYAENVQTKVTTKKSRQTLLFQQDMDLETSNLDNQNNENQLSFVENTNDRQLDKETKSSFEKRKTIQFQNNNDISINLSCNVSVDNHNLAEYNASHKKSASPLKKSKRKTHYYDRNEANIANELCLDENARTCEYKREMQSSSCPDKRKTLHFNNNNDISTEQYETVNKNILPLDKKSSSSMDKRKTIHFEDNNDIEQSNALTEASYNKVPGPTERPLNAAKMSLCRQNAIITLQMTPTTNGSKYRNRYIKETPGTLAFFAEEKKCQMECDEFTSPYRSNVSMKRLPVNLTPLVSMVKKRQTLMFDDCNMDETQAPASSTTTAITDATHEEMDIANELVMPPTTPSTPATHRRSRIPIPLSSGRKSTKSPLLTDICPVVNIDDDEIDEEELLDQVDESLQTLRRATTFTHRMSIEPKSHDPVLEVKESSTRRQPSLFEDNPITISDVSVFFTAQRKSNNNDTTVPLPDLTAAMHTINISGINAIDRNDQDIDQTRLSLVRTLSDDDDDDNDDIVNDEHDNENKMIAECNLACNVQNPETETEIAKTTTDTGPFNDNCANSRFKTRSVNNMRNAHTVCRKCERCQDTFLNETTSSTADSFVLPALPPLPDLGLDRLRRSRNRPTIAEVHVLWQRFSLDRTVINPINISDDDCQIVAEDDKSDDDESSFASKAIRKYYKDRQESEAKLLESLQEKKVALLRQRPFVNRLEDLLSNNSKNWIFDYQMQVRGLFLFSHRKMLTFSVLLTFAEVDPLGIDINLKTVNLQRSHVPKKNWQAIDFVLDFQLKLNLPYDLQSLCEGSNEAGILKMLQEIDRICVETVKMGQALRSVVFSNQASIIRDQSRTYVRKIIRRIVNATDNTTVQHVQKTEIKIELLNLKKLSFKDISTPPLHYFREEIHLLPVGLEFLKVFLPNPLSYLKLSNNQ